MSTYCGKDCEGCSYKEELNCPGCKMGPGRAIAGECKLARCCREKGHESCETCLNKRNCGTWLDKGSMARRRKEAREEEEKSKVKRMETAQALTKWVRILFWLVIPMELFALLGNDKIAELVPSLALPVEIGSGLIRLIYAGVLYRMSKDAYVYRKPASFLVVSALLGMLSNVIPNGKGLTLLVSLPGMVVSLAAIYFEYTAHAEIVAPYQWELSENWHMIWKWQLYSTIGIFANVFLILIAPILGVLAMLGCIVWMIVAGVLKYVYLYRMMKLFGEY